MPQLLHFLRVDKRTKFASEDSEPENEKALFENLADEVKFKRNYYFKLSIFLNKYFFIIKDIDWGTLDIYTCTASCDVEAVAETGVARSAYAREHVFMQRPVSTLPLSVVDLDA